MLVLDDEPFLARLSAQVLKQHYDVDVFHQGASALEALKSVTYACVVSDVSMPSMSGMEFYRRAIAIQPRIERRFLFYTGSPEAILIPGIPHLIKSVEVYRLREVVSSLACLETISGYPSTGTTL